MRRRAAVSELPACAVLFGLVCFSYQSVQLRLFWIRFKRLMAALPVQTAGPLSETGANICGKGLKRLLKRRESGDLACSAGGLVRGGWSEVQPVAGGLARELSGGRDARRRRRRQNHGCAPVHVRTWPRAGRDRARLTGKVISRSPEKGVVMEGRLTAARAGRQRLQLSITSRSAARCARFRGRTDRGGGAVPGHV